MRAERQSPHLVFAVGRGRNHDREFAPAPFSRRAAAAALDLANVASISIAVLLVHLYYSDALFPLWVVSAVGVAWLVLPVWQSGQSLGLRAFGLRMIRVDGGAMDLLELVFRELVSRGLVSLTVIGIAWLAPLTESSGLGGVPTFSGVWGVVLLIAGLNLAFSILGSGVALFRSDRRSAADLLAKVLVVDADAHRRSTLRLVCGAKSPARDLASCWRQHQERKRFWSFIVLEAVCIACGLGLPMLAPIDAQRNESSTFAMSATEPAASATAYHNPSPSSDWLHSLHDQMVRSRDEVNERALRQAFAEQPSWASLNPLISLLTRRGSLREAREVFRAFAETRRDAATAQTFGIWLYKQQFDTEAVGWLETAIDRGTDDGLSNAYLGLALERLGQSREARGAYRRALARDESIGDTLGLPLRYVTTDTSAKH